MHTILGLIDIHDDFFDGSLGSTGAFTTLPKVYELLDDHQWLAVHRCIVGLAF